MQSLQFNRIEDTSVCFFCRKNKVSRVFWNKPCMDCRHKIKKAVLTQAAAKVEPVKLAHRLPAARLQLDATRLDQAEDIYVDKYGRKVENPGYDPVNDPRGWIATGTVQKKGLLIF